MLDQYFKVFAIKQSTFLQSFKLLYLYSAAIVFSPSSSSFFFLFFLSCPKFYHYWLIWKSNTEKSFYSRNLIVRKINPEKLSHQLILLHYKAFRFVSYLFKILCAFPSAKGINALKYYSFQCQFEQGRQL
jgi:hypothetical protein